MMIKGGHVAMLMLVRGMSGHKTQLESKSLSHLSIDLLETREREQQGSGKNGSLRGGTPKLMQCR